MQILRSAAALRLASPLAAALFAASSAQAKTETLVPERYGVHKVTCEYPVKLTHDCSIWRGATRPIALGGFRMSLAAGQQGKIILLAQIRLGPSHNGGTFNTSGTMRESGSSIQAIQQINTALARHGIQLERLQAVKRGRKVDGYFLEFSDNAYDLLKSFTVLESEYWLD